MYLSGDECVACFRGLVTPNNAPVNIYEQVLYWHMLSILLDLGVKFLDHMIILCLTFKGLTNCFSLAPPLHVFISNAEHKFIFSLLIFIFWSFVVCFGFNSHPSGGYEVESPCGLELHFLLANDISMYWWPLRFFSGEISLPISCPFFKLDCLSLEGKVML